MPCMVVAGNAKTADDASTKAGAGRNKSGCCLIASENGTSNRENAELIFEGAAVVPVSVIPQFLLGAYNGSLLSLRCPGP